MLCKRIIPCLDVRNNQVVKGVRFKNHRILGEVLPMAKYYSDAGADELVFYDITASAERRTLHQKQIQDIAATINIPFTVAGGIRTLHQARELLKAGADKVSINSPALENPDLINQLRQEFGSQCVVIGVDSLWVQGDYYVYQYTGDPTKMRGTQRKTKAWLQEVQDRGAGEIVMNCMHADGTRMGFDQEQIQKTTAAISIPVIASGGAGTIRDFSELFANTSVSGALAASIFHDQVIRIDEVKLHLLQQQIEVRI